MTIAPSAKAAQRGEPSYVWRAGQDRRLRMIQEAASDLERSCVLDDGCGIGTYVDHLGRIARRVYGLDYELERVQEARNRLESPLVVCAAGEDLPFPREMFDLVLSNEVIEHVQDDR